MIIDPRINLENMGAMIFKNIIININLSTYIICKNGSSILYQIQSYIYFTFL